MKSIQNIKFAVFSTFLIPSLIFIASCGDTSDGEESDGISTGEYKFTSNNEERTFYLKLPEDYSCDANYSIIFAFHGTGGSYMSYMNGYYNLHEAVGEEAILVYPDALINANGVSQWDFISDVWFFDDLYEHVKEIICFDENRVFGVGHSSGAGLTQTLGQSRSIFRAIGPVAGVLVSMKDCTGRTAIIQVQGILDTMVWPTEAERTRDYWLYINSCQSEADAEPDEGVDPHCKAYKSCEENYPIQYCEHDHEDFKHDYPGHAWPDFAGDAIWDFFKSLPALEPSVDTVLIGDYGSGTLDFKINYPVDFVGTPEIVAIALYPRSIDIDDPIEVMPSYFLNPEFSPEPYTFGTTVSYDDLPINLLGINYDTYWFSVVVYVEGGNYPIPTTDQDYVGFQEITISADTDYEMPTPIDIELLESFK